MRHVFRTADNLVLVRLEMPIAEFPAYLKLGIGSDGRLARTEKLAQDLIGLNFEASRSVEFVRAVCLWGRDPRRAGKVIKRNTSVQISAALREAYVSTREGRIVDALKAVTNLEGLSISFGSKHLKFLNPERHVVLDSVISNRLGFVRDEEGCGYIEWLAVCRQYLEILIAENVEYPGIGSNGWRISDVEMAIFHKIQAE